MPKKGRFPGFDGSGNPNWRGGTTGKGVCRICGGPTWRPATTRCQKCYTRNLTGKNNPYWEHFTSIDPFIGHERAVRRFPLGMCERCGEAPARDRHHKDDNPLNNDPSNIQRLCRRCHMIVDGRLEQVRERTIERNGR